MRNCTHLIVDHQHDSGDDKSVFLSNVDIPLKQFKSFSVVKLSLFRKVESKVK